MRKYLYIFIGIIILILGYFLCFNKDEYYELEDEEEIEENIVVSIEPTIYCVDLKGAVKNPGVYCLKSDSRILDVIKLGGGITTVADTSVLNLSKKIQDEMTVVIYTKTQIKDARTKLKEKQEPTIIEIIKEIEKECICPDIPNDACINPKPENENNNSNNSELININTANKDQLMILPGIGDSKAQAIIDYRNINSFESIDDLKKVSGIGETTFEALKDFITV